MSSEAQQLERQIFQTVEQLQTLRVQLKEAESPPRPAPTPPDPEQLTQGYPWPSSAITKADMIRLTEARRMTRKPITKLLHEAVTAYYTLLAGSRNLRIFPCHGEGKSLWHVVDADAPTEEQPEVIATAASPEAAEEILRALRQPVRPEPAHQQTVNLSRDTRSPIVELTGHDLCTFMRRYRVTIRELSRRTGITQKRIRQVREAGLHEPNAIRDWIEAVTGSDPGPNPAVSLLAIPLALMDKELLRDLLAVNRDLYRAARGRVRQETRVEIEDAMCEASIYATELEDQDPTMTFREICAVAEKRARDQIREVRQAAHGRIEELKREFDLRRESIRAFCQGRPASESQPISRTDND